MKRLTSIAVLLTIAAALATTVISCTNEDNLTEQPAEPAVEQPTTENRTVHVTVGAGFADGSGSGDGTRSAVVNESGTRTLTFTASDRLFVRGEIENASPQKIIAGYLTLDETPAEGATTATFSGDLDVYEYNNSTHKYESSSHTFTTDDPLSECDTANGILVHKDAVGFKVYESGRYGEYTPTTAPTVDELMTQSLSVSGSYDSSSKKFTLGVTDNDTRCTPIFNCNVSGLKSNTTYEVHHIIEDDFESSLDSHGYYNLGSVTTDADGKAVFAGCNVSEKAEMYHALNFISADMSDDRTVYLGTRALESKVYNIGTAASPREALKFQEAKFTVYPNRQVYFSRGNLYAYNWNDEWEWYFYSRQWMYTGASGNNISINASWEVIDLFGWNGESSSYDNYGISGDTDDAKYGSIAGESLKTDWGNNKISSTGEDYSANTWRTLTHDEWYYIFYHRNVTSDLKDANGFGARWTMATIGGKYTGLILFPDSYVHPSGSGYTAGTYDAASDYTTAVTFEFWMQMENAGCVFLPAAGIRNGTEVVDVGDYGSYWAKDSNSDLSDTGYNLSFNKSGSYVENGQTQNFSADLHIVNLLRHCGISVRLVRNAE